MDDDQLNELAEEYNVPPKSLRFIRDKVETIRRYESTMATIRRYANIIVSIIVLSIILAVMLGFCSGS